jgi:hypothetical protein
MGRDGRSPASSAAARAASGQTIAPLSAAMNSRRRRQMLICPSCARSPIRITRSAQMTRQATIGRSIAGPKSSGMHAGEPEAPLDGEEKGAAETGFVSRRWCAAFGSCSCLGVSRRLLGAARTFALKGRHPEA